MSMISNLDLIRRIPLFSLLTTDQAQQVAQNVVKRQYKRGQLIVEQGHKSDEMVILLTGRARVLTSDHRGREVILAALAPGDCIGEMSMIDNGTHSATVRADVQCDALVLSRAFVEYCLPDRSSLSFALMHALVRRLRQANRQIESLALLQVYDRVFQALLNMAELEDGRQVIRRRVNRQDLAKLVGASREMVSRVMKNLQERGSIEPQEDGTVLLRSHLMED
jgi:CRP/FNR family cyclic AMP-dependent transcriptional regulator